MSDVARRLGVAKSTAHPSSSRRYGRGITETSETGRYRLGLHLVRAGPDGDRPGEAAQEAFPLLEELRERTGHSIHLSVPEARMRMYLERLLTLRGIRSLGTDRATAAVARHQRGESIRGVRSGTRRGSPLGGFPPITPYTIRALRSTSGISTRFAPGAMRPASTSSPSAFRPSAAPIFGTDGAVRGAVSILNTTDRMRLGSQRMARLVVQAAERALPPARSLTLSLDPHRHCSWRKNRLTRHWG